jgi:hypothetical protein
MSTRLVCPAKDAAGKRCGLAFHFGGPGMFHSRKFESVQGKFIEGMKSLADRHVEYHRREGCKDLPLSSAQLRDAWEKESGK